MHMTRIEDLVMAMVDGSIKVGEEADLLLIDGDPLQNIEDIRKINLVIKADHYFDPYELHRQLGVKPFVKEEALF